VAKVLACPACEHKHPLDLLVGLDSFVCKNCGRKLAVPNEVNEMAQDFQASRIDEEFENEIENEIAPSTIREDAKVDLEHDGGEIVVLARASLGITEEREKQLPPQALTQSSSTEGSKVQKQKESAKAPLKISGPLSEIIKLSKIPIPIFGKIAAWLFALPFGFFVVVLLPRFFQRGFHASDFVGVITKQGIGRYGIVVTLIFFWSVATVLGIFAFNLLFRRFFLLKKMAK